MKLLLRGFLITAIPLLGIVLVLFGRAETVHGQDSPMTFTDFGMESEFPEGIRFFAEIETSIEIEDVRVIFDVGNRAVTQYNYLDIPRSGGSLIAGELFVSTNNPERYIPPGAVIKYRLEVFGTDGKSYLSERREQLLLDARYEWDTVKDGPVTVYFHGPVQSRAETLAAKSREGLELMAGVTGAEIETPIAVMLYNNYAEMIGAVVPRSSTISRELVTEGQAFGEENTVLVLAGRSDIGTVTHEITHVLIGRASNGANLVPFWLNEGLAEFGNLDQTISYTRFLEWGIGTGRLPTLRSMNSPPGDPNLTLVGYGSGRSVVEFMLSEFGEEKMAQLLATLGTGVPIEPAIGAVYDMALADLEVAWRTEIGADEYVAPTPAPTAVSAAPTATVAPLLPFTLDDIVAAGRSTPESGEPDVNTPDANVVEELGEPAEGEQQEPETSPATSSGSCSSAAGGPAQAAPLLGITALLALAVWRRVMKRAR